MGIRLRPTTIQEFVDKGEAELKTGPFGTQLHASDYVESGTPVINVRNIGFGSIIPEKLEFIDDGTVNRLKEHLLRQDDIVFGRKGAVERHVFVKDAQQRWFQGSDCLRLRVSSPELSPRFLSYSFLTDAHKQWMINQCSHGATMASLNQAIICRIPLKLPDIKAQEAIVSVLSGYDRLIENNTGRIKILDEMAQTIYREWFVKFRFPEYGKVRMVGSKLGLMPEGWCQDYAVHVDFLEGPGLRRWQYRDTGLRFLNIRTIGNGDIDLTKTQFIDSAEAQAKYRHFLLAEYDHVVSSSGTIGRIVTVRRDHLPLMLNTSVIRMRPKGDCVGRWQLKHFLKSNYFQTQILSFASGVAQMNFGPMHLKQMKIVAPPNALGRKYEAIVAPIEELILNLIRKNKNLRVTRDLLLPKLISGEINVAEAEQEAVAQGV